MNSAFGRILLAALLLVVVTQAVAQRQNRKGRDDFTLKVDVDLRLLHVTVFDWKEQLVKGLKQDHFEVYEDKIQQEITLFKVEDIPVSLGLVIDNSGSMKFKRPRVNQAAITFAKTSNPEDEVFLINFNDQVFLDQDYTRNLDDLTDALDHIDARGATALYDAIYLALEHIREGQEEKKAILVITDGQDTESRYRFDTVLEFARESYASIYLIGLFDKMSELSRKERKAAKLLKQLSEETGGKYFFPESVDEVHAICTEVAHEIRNQYTLGYKPTNLSRDGTWRDVTVRVLGAPKGKRKWIARTKRGYYAPTES